LEKIKKRDGDDNETSATVCRTWYRGSGNEEDRVAADQAYGLTKDDRLTLSHLKKKKLRSIIYRLLETI
jgi:hypothetical protein